MEKINFGCGEDYKEGWINIDSNKSFKADIYHDLNKFPYPFKQNSFKEIYMKDILEHLEFPVKVLKEIIKISKNNAKLTLIVPHATSYAFWTNIMHKINFTESSFDKSLMKEYGLEKSLILKKRKFIYKNKFKKYLPFKKYLKIFFNGIYDDILFEFEIRKN